MKKTLLLFPVVLLLLGVAAAQEKAAPQDAGPAGMYRLDFVIREMDGTKVINTRNYSMLVQTPTAHLRVTDSDVRAGTKVPVSVGTKDGQTQIQYTDVGVYIRASLTFRDDGPLVLGVATQISSLAMPEPGAQAPPQPIIRTANSNGTGVLVPGKALLVSSVDDPASNHKFTVEVMSTKLM